MSNFKVGDYVRGISNSIYGITDDKMTKAEVTEVKSNGDIAVKILKHTSGYSGNFYTLKPAYFVGINKFEIGDVVKGSTPENEPYGYTNTDMTVGKVIDVVDNYRVVVEILAHSKYPRAVGKAFTVESKYFDLTAMPAEPAPLFKVGDYVTGKAGNGYTYTNEDMTLGEVIKTKDDQMFVRILKHVSSYAITQIGKEYWVDMELFDKVDYTPEEIKPARKFKIGDFVFGTAPKEKYYQTSTEMSMGEVIDVLEDNKIKVKIIEHSNSSYIGREWKVEEQYFEMYVPAFEKAKVAEEVTAVNPFKVGDIIKGNSATRYCITNTEMTAGEVTKVYNATKVRVLVKEHASDLVEIGNSYEVDVQYFDLVEPAPKFKVGDRVKGTSDMYGVTNTKMFVGEVVEVRGKYNIKVKVLVHASDRWTGSEFYVDSENFEKIVKRVKPEVTEAPEAPVEVAGAVKEESTGILKRTDGTVDYYRIGNVTLALPKGCPVGFTRKHPDDSDNTEMAEALAFARLLKDSKVKGLVG